MRKIFSLFAALTLSVGLWAESVSYRYPVYNEGGVTKGIASWQTSAVEATPITSSSSTWGITGETTWFVVNENVTISQRVTCNGDIHLILANGVTLTAQKGITVTGTNSFTIYAQTEDIALMGQLIADATSVESAAGIGGGSNGSGSYITINGGTITANGGYVGAGIGGGSYGSGSYITINGGEVTATSSDGGAGIGGGTNGSGSNITINGGEVTANGGDGAAGIGGGWRDSGSYITINGGEVTATGASKAAGIGGGHGGSGSYITILASTVTANGGDGAAGIGGGVHGDGSNISILAGNVTANGGEGAAGIGGGMESEGEPSTVIVATSLVVKAGNSNPPTTEIENNGGDLASSLDGKQYVTITDPLPDAKTAAIAAVNAEIAETDNDNVKAIATNAVIAINAAMTEAEVNALKTLAIANIASAKAAYGEAYTAGETAGDAAGYQRAQDELPTIGDCGPTVIITKGDKTLKLYNVDGVEYKITECPEK